MLISIITINRNNAEGLKRTMESVHSQTYTDFQYIIIDGNSEDESMEIVSQFYFKEFLISSEPDDGIYDAMNKGILKAAAEYLIFMNSGDVFYDNKSLELISRYIFQNNSIDIYYGNYYLGPQLIVLPSKLDLHFFRGITFSICHQATATKKSLLLSSGLFSLKYKIHSDTHFFLKSFIEGSVFGHINSVLVKYETGGISGTISAAIERRRVFKNSVPYFLRIFSFSYFIDAFKWHFNRRIYKI